VEHNRRALVDLKRWLEAYDMPGHGPATAEGAQDIAPGEFKDTAWTLQASHGLRIRLRAPGGKWPTDMYPCLELDIANESDKPLRYDDHLICDCQLQCDGKSYEMRVLSKLPIAPQASVPPGKLVRGAVFIPLELYLSSPFSSVHESLAEGDHEVRVSLGPRGLDAKEPVRIQSNLVTVHIKPADEATATAATGPAPAIVDRTLSAHLDQWDLDLDGNAASKPVLGAAAAHSAAADLYVDFTSTGMPVTPAPHLKVLPLAMGLRGSLEVGSWTGPGSLDGFIRHRNWLLSQLDRPAGPAPGRLARLDSLLPRTFAFRTAEGNSGIVQIISFTDAPRAVRVRYLVFPKPAGPATRTASTQPWPSSAAATTEEAPHTSR
jgi:hypothetical protein